MANEAATGESTITPQDDSATEQQELDKNIADFFSHSFGDAEDEAAGAVISEEDKKAAIEGQAKPNAEEGAAAPAPEPDPAKPAASGNAEPTAPTEGQAGQQASEPQTGAPAPEVDQADLAAMLGLADAPKPKAQEAPKGEGAATEKPSATSTPAEDEPYTPFQPTFQLKPETVSALFESEDTETRHKALVGLLSAFGNTLTQVMDQRIREHHAPRMQQSFAQVMTAEQQQQLTMTDFFTAHEDLKPYGKAVHKAFQVIAEKNPTAPYTPELRDKVANLARAAVRAAGVKLEPKKAAAPASTAPKKEPKATPFEAGGARPGGTGSNADNGPADLVQQLSAF